MITIMNLNANEKQKLLRLLIKDGYTNDEIDCIVQQKFPEFSLRYQDHKFKLPYRPRKNEFKTSIHWGQRKLLMSCIQFLNRYHRRAKLVVYAGAAPGSNVLILAGLFPEHRFDLYDPRDFDSDLRNHPRIRIFQEYFTDDTAAKYTKNKVLFWSDIRTGCTDDPDFEEQIQENNRMQERWHHIIKPEFAMYKFRLPYAKGNTEYMRGQIWMQLWAPETSTETRLVVCKNPTTKIYSHSKYEKRMYYFNLITRQWAPYESSLCLCFDCRAECEIMKEYLQKRVKELTDGKIEKMREKISKALSPVRTPYQTPHDVLLKVPMWYKYSKIRQHKNIVLSRHMKKIEYRDKKLNPNATILK